jgi:predicted Rossmann fold flavoprotein
MNDSADVVVIGGGAAGLMCAMTAGSRGRRVRVIEHANRVGKKILMSGGGRCNFTNTGTTAANFLSANPHYCKSALARYKPAQFIEMVERHGIAYHEKELGQLFCDDSSKQIVRMLLDECDAAGVRIEVPHASTSRAWQPGRRWFPSAHVAGCDRGAVGVVASGGLSIPSMGASGFGYALARQFGHTVLPTRAGLVPLTLTGTHQNACRT